MTVSNIVKFQSDPIVTTTTTTTATPNPIDALPPKVFPSASTTPTVLPSHIGPLTPTVSFDAPYVDPPFTKRAHTTFEMYSLLVDGSLNYVYEVGRHIRPSPIPITIRNNTVTTDLLVTLALPPYLLASVSTTFLLTKDTTTEFLVTFNEAMAQELSFSPTVNTSDLLSITVVPQSVTGPVHVRTNLDELKKSKVGRPELIPGGPILVF